MIICSNFQLYHYNVIDNNNIIYRKSVKMAKINDFGDDLFLMTVFFFSCPVFYTEWEQCGSCWWVKLFSKKMWLRATCKEELNEANITFSLWIIFFVFVKSLILHVFFNILKGFFILFFQGFHRNWMCREPMGNSLWTPDYKRPQCPGTDFMFSFSRMFRW